MILSDLRLCLLTDIATELFLHQVITGGVSSVQLRAKNLNKSEFYDLAIRCKSILEPINIPLIINDHVDVASEVNADGVHIGQSDCYPMKVRDQLGPDKWIGWSIETLEQLDIANSLDCIDYVAASAVFASKNKTDCKTYWGLSGLKTFVKHSRHPVVAIGGINSNNINNVMNCGVSGVAVIGAIHDSNNPRQAASNLINSMFGG